MDSSQQGTGKALSRRLKSAQQMPANGIEGSLTAEGDMPSSAPSSSKLQREGVRWQEGGGGEGKHGVRTQRNALSDTNTLGTWRVTSPEEGKRLGLSAVAMIRMGLWAWASA